jgi:hypothetical protein
MYYPNSPLQEVRETMGNVQSGNLVAVKIQNKCRTNKNHKSLSLKGKVVCVLN